MGYFVSCVVANANKIIPCYYAACLKMGITFYRGVVLEKRLAENKAHRKNSETVGNFLKCGNKTDLNHQQWFTYNKSFTLPLAFKYKIYHRFITNDVR